MVDLVVFVDMNSVYLIEPKPLNKPIMNQRKNVYKLPVGDPTLEWYAKAVLSMKKKPTSDPTSWNYQAAMHGFDIKKPYWKDAPPLPLQKEQLLFWEKCQHQSYFFFPWHRMYLAYFEQIVAQEIVSLGGPVNWTLPFWDYSDTTNVDALSIPTAFTTPADPSNGLWMKGRQHNTIPDYYVTLEALDTLPFIGVDTTGAATGFGGPETPFSHYNDYNGKLEEKPHNFVHGAIGGAMGNPNTAGLDPIFWLHHANIDRLWQEWLNKGGRFNPTNTAWLDFTFDFHDQEGNTVDMKCSDVLDTRKVLSGYTYEGTAPGVPTLSKVNFIKTLKKIDFTMPLEVVAATNKQLSLSSATTIVPLKLTPPPRKKANLTFIDKVFDVPKKTILKFENIKGKGAPPIQDIYLNVPETVAEKKSYYAGSISLFGVEGASRPSLHHSGSGQNYALDITDLMNKLRSLPNWDERQLTISIEPMRPMDEDAAVKIGRISLYSE